VKRTVPDALIAGGEWRWVKAPEVSGISGKV
jgi:hypothetical protein